MHASPRPARLPLPALLYALGTLAGSACSEGPLSPADGSLQPGTQVNLSVSSTPATYLPCASTVPIRATLTNASTGAPLAGLLLNFNVLAGGGSMYGGNAITNASGQASDSWTLGSVANLANTFAIRTVSADGTKTEHYRKTVTTTSRIAFVSERDGNPEIYTQLPNGTGVKRLTSNPATDTEPAWSPDGSKIAFTSNRSGQFLIYVMNADGTNVRLLRSEGSGLTDTHPTWSPDGRRIAFERYANSVPPQGFVLSANAADGTDLMTLAAPTFSIATDPAWSPDGSKIVFADNLTGQFEIYTASATAETTPVQLTYSDAADRYPTWSPDGTEIVFTSDRNGNDELYVVKADGTGLRRLTTFSGEDLEPSWSPDGSQIVFASLRGTKYDAYSVNAADGSGLVQRTTNAANDYFPNWSRCTRS